MCVPQYLIRYVAIIFSESSHIKSHKDFLMYMVEGGVASVYPNCRLM